MFSIDSTELRKRLAIAGRFTPKKTILPILEHVRVEARENGDCFLIASNMEVSAVVRLPINPQPGVWYLKPSILDALLATYQGEVYIAHTTIQDKKDNANLLTLVCNGSHINLADPYRDEEFVEVCATLLGKGKSVCEITVEAEVFCNAAKRVMVAASSDYARPVLTGVLFEIDFKNGNLILVAINGFCLATDHIAIQVERAEDDLPANALINVPARFLDKVIKLAKKGELTINILDNEPGARLISFLLPGAEIELTSQTIMGTFPEYRTIIPNDYAATIFAFQGVDMLRALRRIRAVNPNSMRNRWYSGSLTLGQTVVSEKSLLLKSVSDEHGEIDETLNITCIQGEDYKFALNYCLLAQGIVDSGEITFSQKDKTLPIKITAKALPNFTYVMMPMHHEY